MQNHTEHKLREQSGTLLCRNELSYAFWVLSFLFFFLLTRFSQSPLLLHLIYARRSASSWLLREDFTHSSIAPNRTEPSTRRLWAHWGHAGAKQGVLGRTLPSCSCQAKSGRNHWFFRMGGKTKTECTRVSAKACWCFLQNTALISLKRKKKKKKTAQSFLSLRDARKSTEAWAQKVGHHNHTQFRKKKKKTTPIPLH